MELIEQLQWRYATKRYSDKKVADELIEKIIEATRLSASSLGLQPYRLLVVENEDLRQQLATHSLNPQVTQASHLFVFAAFDSIDETMIDEYMHLIARKRSIPLESLAAFRKNGPGSLLGQTDAEFFIWATKQAYIALGTALIAAAVEKVDATPMEGFSAEKFDEVLGLKEKGLRSVVLLAVGYRDVGNDSFGKLEKVRWPSEEFVTHLK